jgi:tRNA-uridine 2-sulfurtransferase
MTMMMMTTTETRPTTAAVPVESAPDDAAICSFLGGLSGKRVAVALSGGVDSAVAALRLRQAGADLVGLSLRLHDPDPHNPLAPRACCPPEDLQDARRVAEMLGFPFYVLDARAAFSERVVDPFVKSYLAGKTPNPCVGCNSFVKLDRLWQRAQALGCVALATGHYARTRMDTEGHVHLYGGRDKAKDQSYFLFGLGKSILHGLVFPLGGLSKDEVKTLAIREGLPVAHKLESQEVCFVGGRGAGQFVMRRPESQGDHSGPLLDESGQVVGRHPGIMHFTVGQRRGIGVAAKNKLHVLGIDAASRAVVVGPEAHLMKLGLRASKVVWTPERPTGPVQAHVRIRYRDPGTLAWVEPMDEDRVEVRFTEPVRAIAPGQAAVFYAGEKVLGGAWIDQALPNAA